MGGVVSYGVNLAYFVRKYPFIAHEYYKFNVVFCLTFSLVGPLGIIFPFTEGGFKFKLWF